MTVRAAGAGAALVRSGASAGGAAAGDGCAAGVTAGATIAADGTAAGGRLDGPPLPLQPATVRVRMNQETDRTHFTP